MPLCLQKKESIKSATIGLFVLFREWYHNNKITQKEYKAALMELAKIEKCTNLEETYRLDAGKIRASVNPL